MVLSKNNIVSCILKPPYYNKIDEYACKQPLLSKSDFNVSLDNVTCEKLTFKWYKRNNSEDDFDDGVRYKTGCVISYDCGDGACLTNNTETCLSKDASPNFTCTISNTIVTMPE